MNRREVKGKGEKERYTHLNADFQRIARRDKKASSAISAKKQRKTIEWESLEISSRKLELPREHFMQRWTYFILNIILKRFTQKVLGEGEEYLNQFNIAQKCEEQSTKIVTTASDKRSP